jgi:hypothetical protein
MRLVFDALALADGAGRRARITAGSLSIAATDTLDSCYGLSRPIDKRGRDGKVIDWLDELTTGCLKKQARNINDTCGVKRPELARVL